MAAFYDFLFYFIYNFYAGKEKGAASSSAGIIGGLQAMNVLTVVMIYSFFISPEEFFNAIIVIVVFLFFQITTYIRYIYKDGVVEKIKDIWLKKNDAEQTRIRFLSFLYIFLSLVFSIGLAIYIGSTR